MEEVEPTKSVSILKGKEPTLDPNFTPPWPEWNDDEIKTENWTDSGENGFVDPTGQILPPSITAVQWIRPTDLFSDPLLVGPQSPTLDLINPNAHLCELSELIRFILADISELYELSLDDDFDCEGENSFYVANSVHPWRPWDHIYTKEVKGSTPQFNPDGRYILRLYYMGKWRRIVVDDQIPLLRFGIFGLPMTSTFELWPLLLTKGLLKIASLSWDRRGEVLNFSPISCLTGFIHDLHHIANPVDTHELWLYFSDVLPKYKRPQFPKRSRRRKYQEHETDSLFSLHPPPLTSGSESESGKSKKNKGKKKKGKKSGSSASSSEKKTKKSKKSKSKSKSDGETTSGDDTKKIQDQKSPSKKSKKGDTSATTTDDEKDGKPRSKKKKKSKGKETEEEGQGSSRKKKKSKDKKKKDKKKKKGKQKKPNASQEEEETEYEKECEPSILDLNMAGEEEDLKFNSLQKYAKNLPDIPQGHCAGDPPSMQEIVKSVQKYAGPLYQSAMSNLVKEMGRDDPIMVTVLFLKFPKDEQEKCPKIPSFLYHPTQLSQIRDEPLASECRPSTPLWKTYRWKDWAMKKGLIPIDSSFNRTKPIRSVQAKTPFPFKTDWHDRIFYLEEYGEQSPLDENYEGPIQLPNLFKIPQGSTMDDVKKIIKTPPPTVATPTQGQSSDSEGRKSKRKSKKKDKKSKGKKSKSKSKKSESDGGKKSGQETDRKSRKSKKSKSPKGTEDGKKKKKSKSGSGSSKKSKKGKKKKKSKSKSGGESDKEPLKKPEVIPTKSCQHLWIDVKDVAASLIKLSKFYTSQNHFGSTYILRRNSKKSQVALATTTHGAIDKGSEVKFNDLFKGQDDASLVLGAREIREINNELNSLNVTIKLDRGQEIQVQDWQMHNIDDLDSGFYLFSDSFTEQELIFSLDVLHDSTIMKFSHKKVCETKSEKRPITVIVKLWDWRQDGKQEGKVIVISANQSCLTHLPLPPGRHLFRIWLLDEPSEVLNAASLASGDANHKKVGADSHFTLKILSHCPIHLGDRRQAQNLMTNQPVQFLRQADMLTRSVWTLLLSFGQKGHWLGKCLKNLRQSYCPAYSEPNVINKVLKPVHPSFEQYFFEMIRNMNDGRIDRWLLFAIRSLLLSPTLGRTTVKDKEAMEFKEKMLTHRKLVRERADSILLDLEERHNLPEIVCAAKKIQRYFRGWQVRQYFQGRRKSHKHFGKLELQIRKIALLLARNSDSKFSVSREDKHLRNSKINVMPRPPRWAVELLNYLLAEHPWLITIYPHAYSVPLHLKIKDVTGIMPGLESELGNSDWIPFYRQPIVTAGESNWTFVQFDLQTYPNEEVMIEVVDNDTNSPLTMEWNQLFLGRLESNKLGYTILCYKLKKELSKINFDDGDREHSKSWTLRLITPEIQTLPLLRDKSSHMENVQVGKLCLNRFTGYFIPNDDFCICRYTLKIREPLSYISIRFKASCDTVKLCLQIWDLLNKKIVFESRNVGSFIIPSIRLEHILPNEEITSNLDGGDPNYLENHNEIEEGEDAVNSKYLQKYALGIFVQDQSWPLTDGEWKFVQYQTKKFWKKMMVFRDQADATQKLDPIENPIKINQEEVPSLSFISEGTNTKSDLTEIFKKEESVQSDQDNPEEETNKEIEDSTESIKNLVTSSSTGWDVESTSGTGLSPTKEPEKSVPELPESTKTEALIMEIPLIVKDEDVVSDDEEFVEAKIISENLTIFEGGQDSQLVMDFNQPHFLLEILSDENQQIQFQSNRRTFQEKLIQTKKDWESQQQGRYLQGRRARHRFLAKHLVPIDSTDADPFAFIEPMSKFYSCLYLDKSQLDGLNLAEWLPAAKQKEEEPPVELDKKLEVVMKKQFKKIKKSLAGKKVPSKSSTVGSSRKSKIGKELSKKKSKSLNTKSKNNSKPKNKEKEIKPLKKKGKRGASKKTDVEETSLDPEKTVTIQEPSQGDEEGKEPEIIIPPTRTHSPRALGQRYCAPPPRSPTHILLGPSLEKCGLTPCVNGFPSLDKQILGDIHGLPLLNPNHEKSQRERTLEQEKDFQIKHFQTRQDLMDLHDYHSYIWTHFNEHVYSNIFCELEQNRQFLETFRNYYQDIHLGSPERTSSVDLHIKSVQEFLQEGVLSQHSLMHQKEDDPSTMGTTASSKIETNTPKNTPISPHPNLYPH